jgi:hypothetical protein
VFFKIKLNRVFKPTLVFVVGVEFMAHHTAFVKTTSTTNGMRQFHRTTMGAKTNGGNGGFPLGTTMTLLGMTHALLGNWHNGTPLSLE